MSRKLIQHLSCTLKSLKQKAVWFFVAGLLGSLLFSLFSIGMIEAYANTPAWLLPTFNQKHTVANSHLTENPSESNFIRTQPQLTMPFTIGFNQIDEFPLGIYDRIDRPEHTAEIKNMGFNLVMPYTNPYAKKDFQIIRTYLDAANAVGLKVVLEPFRESIEQREFAAITEFVNEFKDHPAVAAWYSYDEPAFNNISVGLLEDVYQLIKAEDSVHPVILDFSIRRADKLTGYANSFDIYQVNQYPLQKTSNTLQAFKRVRQDIVNVANLINNVPFWFVVQSFENKKWRLPNVTEQKYQLYSGLLNGANGIFFYSYHRAPLKWQNSVVRPLVAELKTYLPAIETGSLNGNINSDRNNLQLGLYPNTPSNQLILVAINHEANKIDAKINLDSNLNLSSVVSKQNNIAIDEENGFTDSFEPFEVKIYTLNS
jgi:hypothetical protein